ncbi:uncharacterized protein A1O9_11641 [Exophiala aquamarina CBS 119918]|uniref:Xylanolytic transcriptional activator regulatory domain-containing protein n=1 Tax=Exophiala aquamarina CBS 119918 TaxID=1182545 RepID=A0A072PA18_9EURO|nr:uncharacterized protein A1O9_11641 [Exophiala aquamarina CBS 119918]KEF52400.1 hypothetical protein A1O9_11641 [Exophiala aquamarina CBS 119918]
MEDLLERPRMKHTTQAPNHPRPSANIATFPPYRVAVLLFQCYETYIDHISRILHIPTVRALMKAFYLRLTQGKSGPPGQAALLFSIFALAAVFYQPFEHSEVVSNEDDAINLAKVMGKGALDTLDYSRRSTSGTLEDIQAYILMSYVIFHLDGLSATGHLLSATAGVIAKGLCLHKLDVITCGEKSTNLRDMIDREVKRRVFWYIASQDWLSAAISGPQEGTYSIHPNHINVRLPTDCNDDDFVLGGDTESENGPQPNSTTYFIEKIRLAHICREIVDTVPLDTNRLQQMPYDKIIDLDQKLLDFISNLPFFFKLDAASRQRAKPLETMYLSIQLQRYCITGAVHSRRCKLHQRFLLRQSSDSRYTYSRRACLESAHTIMQFYEGFSDGTPPRTLRYGKTIAAHYVHLAMVVLVMDLCFNKDQADEVAIKKEVKAGLQMFEDASDASPLLGRFISSINRILAKYDVYLNDPSTTLSDRDVHSGNEIDSGPFGATYTEQSQPSHLHLEMSEPSEIPELSFDEFWERTMQAEPNTDLLAWDNMFSTLDSRPL